MWGRIESAARELSEGTTLSLSELALCSPPKKTKHSLLLSGSCKKISPCGTNNRNVPLLKATSHLWPPALICPDKVHSEFSTTLFYPRATNVPAPITSPRSDRLVCAEIFSGTQPPLGPKRPRKGGWGGGVGFAY